LFEEKIMHRLWASAAVALLAATDGGPLSGGDAVSIPGLARLQGMVAAMVPFALVGCVLAVIVGAAMWALGGVTSNPHRASQGKSTVLWSLVAAVVIGAAGFLVGWANAQGSTIS
jgi:hypothetical protein